MCPDIISRLKSSVFYVMFASGRVFCRPCAQSVSVLHEDEPLRTETCGSETV
jgi:hypothetical protein